MEQYLASKAGAICAEDIIMLEIRGDARNMFAIVSSSLQALLSHLIDPLPEIVIVAENAFQAPIASQQGEPTEEEMKEALIRTMQMQGGQRKPGDAVASENAIGGMTLKILEFEKLGCKPADRGAGYFCTYKHTSRLSAHSNEGTEAGERHADGVNMLLGAIMGGSNTRSGVVTRRFVQSKQGWMVSKE
jgi:hypothetical protein